MQLGYRDQPCYILVTMKLSGNEVAAVDSLISPVITGQSRYLETDFGKGITEDFKEDLAIDLGKNVIGVGSSTSVIAVVNTKKASTDNKISFSSSNPKVAQVMPNGSVIGISGGEADIFAVCDGLTKQSVHITVKDKEELNANEEVYDYINTEDKEYYLTEHDFSVNMCEIENKTIVAQVVNPKYAIDNANISIQAFDFALERNAVYTYYVVDAKTGEVKASYDKNVKLTEDMMSVEMPISGTVDSSCYVIVTTTLDGAQMVYPNDLPSPAVEGTLK